MEISKEWFMKLGPASFIYAIIYTICSYDNTAGITIPIWIGATICYACYVMKKVDVAVKKDSLFWSVIMMLLGISTAITGNEIIILFNYVAFFGLLLIFLLYNFNTPQKWGMDKVILEMCVSVCGAIGKLLAPFEEGMAYVRLRKKEKASRWYYIALGIIIAVPFMLIIGVCLSSADAVFADMIKSNIQIENTTVHIMRIVIMFSFGFFSAYCGMRFFAIQRRPSEDLSYQKHNPTIAVTFTSILTIMYLVFSVIQVVYLFLGYGVLPDGMTYADYARTGFFELLFVAVVNLLLVVGMKKFFQENRLLNAIFLVICACTFIMVASSAYRMLLYIGAYHLTFLRLLVLVMLGGIAVLITLIAVYVVKPSFPWFRYGLMAACILYTVFSLAHVDYWITSYNLSHIESDNEEEMMNYIQILSSDAAPAIIEYVESNSEMKSKIEHILSEMSEDEAYYYAQDSGVAWYLDYQERILNRSEEMGIRTFNLSYYIASKTLLTQ